ncbi:type II toxin-antitoxin system RelE/ParE family toxin [Helicobacter cetorum]|uniref:type II toxin-antitoxin system RelE/ParE family toxin n=1 Tax=Helicobacter cetorum TaxID=138563 RepID=UPI000CF04C35|nr:type II toxin-antitoxin system RelE/ParE family toxin [Helicobacter cetorum]
MIIKQTKIFKEWLENLKDKKSSAIIKRRLIKIESTQLLGDFKSLGSNLFEMRFFCSSGYRVYFTFRGSEIILLLAGGIKDTQTRDIKKAREILKGFISE